MDQARDKIQKMVDDGLLPKEQAVFMMESVVRAQRRRDRAGSSQGDVSGQRDQRRSTISQVLIADGITGVKIDNPLGDLLVTAPSSEGVQVVVEREIAAAPSEDFDRLLKQIRVVDTREGGILKLLLYAPDTNPDTKLEARIMVLLPHGLDAEGRASGTLELRGLQTSGAWTAEGEIRVRDVRGVLHLSAVNGDVRLRDVQGEFDVHVEDGEVDVERAEGNLKISCLNGDVRIQSLRGDLHVSAPDGRLAVRDMDGAVYARIGAGGVDLRDARVSDLDISVATGDAYVDATPLESANVRLLVKDGDLTLLLPKDIGGDVTMEADDGAMQCDVPLRDVNREGGVTRAAFAEGDSIIHLAARSGNVRLAWRED